MARIEFRLLVTARVASEDRPRSSAICDKKKKDRLRWLAFNYYGHGLNVLWLTSTLHLKYTTPMTSLPCN